jgi:hypothetical protein
VSRLYPVLIGLRDSASARVWVVFGFAASVGLKRLYPVLIGLGDSSFARIRVVCGATLTIVANGLTAQVFVAIVRVVDPKRTTYTPSSIKLSFSFSFASCIVRHSPLFGVRVRYSGTFSVQSLRNGVLRVANGSRFSCQL